jgi:hypothetical protein
MVIQEHAMSVLFFPTVLIILDIAAAAIYLIQGDLRHGIYWLSAAVLTASITY